MSNPRKDTRICRLIRGKPNAVYMIGVGPGDSWVNLHRKYSLARWFGCEPNPRVYSKLKDQFPGPILPVALYRETGEVILHLPLRQPVGWTSLYAIDRIETIPLRVRAITLDEFDVWAGRPSRTLLWMDIEGAELDALRGGTRLLSSGRAPWINLEVRDDPIAPGAPSQKDLTDYLASYGYRLRLNYHKEKLVKGGPVTHWDAVYTL